MSFFLSIVYETPIMQFLERREVGLHTLFSFLPLHISREFYNFA